MERRQGEMDKVNVAQWRKSTRCGSSACVEVAKVDDRFLVRDSKDPRGTVLSFTEQEWQAFVEGIEAGEFRF
jgi:hypothetical protein